MGELILNFGYKPDNWPWWWNPVVRSQLRRAINHDYRSKCVYMITLNKNPEIPVLSSLEGNPTIIGSKCGVIINIYGKMVSDAIIAFKERNACIKVPYFIIMPDHVHLIVFVTDYLPKHLGKYISYLKSDCSKRLWLSHPELKERGNDGAFFAPKYNDRILWREGQWTRWELYIRDNPRRALLRRMFPDYYRRSQIVGAHGESLYSYGNTTLIAFPDKIVVRYTSKRTPEENDIMLSNCRILAQEGWIMVSPFIHPREKELLIEGMARGWRIIRIVEDAITERKHPSKMMHEYCATGNLLLVALRHPGEIVDKGETRRSIFMKMNALAEKIERTDWRY